MVNGERGKNEWYVLQHRLGAISRRFVSKRIRDIVWDTSSVIDMSSMFESARSLTSVPFNWDVSKRHVDESHVSRADNYRPEAFRAGILRT